MPLRHVHDIENDLEHTIPPEGGPDSAYLFQVMTERALALLDVTAGQVVADLGSGMGQDTLALAARVPSGRVIGLEPSNRMIRFGQGLATGKFGRPPALKEGRVEGGATVTFIRSFGEELPLATASVDALICKGALDHFIDPQLTMAEVARVLRPGGRAVIALANYDSLACRWGRAWDQRRLRRDPQAVIDPHPVYEPPPDHITRFGYDSILALASDALHLNWVEGLSLLWGSGPWARLIAAPPAPLAWLGVRKAGVIGRLFPRWADVTLIQLVRR